MKRIVLLNLVLSTVGTAPILVAGPKDQKVPDTTDTLLLRYFDEDGDGKLNSHERRKAELAKRKVQQNGTNKESPSDDPKTENAHNKPKPKSKPKSKLDKSSKLEKPDRLKTKELSPTSGSARANSSGSRKAIVEQPGSKSPLQEKAFGTKQPTRTSGSRSSPPGSKLNTEGQRPKR